jgi:hypothetical protein
MIDIKHMITFFLEQCKNVLKLKLVITGLVIVGIGFLVWRIPGWFGSQNNLSGFSLVELISRLNNLEIINSNEYIGFNDSRIPFTFEYPSNWKVIVNLTLNRECCVETITLTSPMQDFRIYIDFFEHYNPYYKDISNFVRNPELKGDPFTEMLITIDPRGFYSLVNTSFAEPLLISHLGGVERPKSSLNSTYQLTSAPLILGQRQSVYQQRGEQASENIILGKQNPELLKVLTLRVNYQVVNNSPELVWVVNQNVFVRILSSIQLVA